MFHRGSLRLHLCKWEDAVPNVESVIEQLRQSPELAAALAGLLAKPVG